MSVPTQVRPAQTTALVQAGADGVPASTTWVGGASGDFETAANWNTNFATIDLGGGNYALQAGDATIGADVTVTFQGPLPADIASLALGAGSVLEVTQGQLSIDGTSLDSTNAGTIEVAGTAQLTASGTIDNTEGTIAAASGGTVLLQDATIRNGELDATQGLVAVVGSATLDGSGGAGSVGLDGLMQVGSGATLIADGWINPGLDGGGIELGGGTLLIGNATTDAVTLAPSLPGSAEGSGGYLVLDDATGSVVTGADSGASLTNEATIVGSGTLGNGQLAIGNAASGLILATGDQPLVIDGGASPVSNAGLIEAGAGTLDLRSNVNNAGGTISAGGGAAVFDGIDIGGGPLFITTADPGETILDGIVVSGGTLATATGGLIAAVGSTAFDGTTDVVVLASGAQALVGGGDVLTLAGRIANAGTLSVLGNGSSAAASALEVSGAATLSGGGSVLLADGSGAGSASTQVITGRAPGDTFDNVDNTIGGYGRIGTGDATLTLINEAAGTVEASGGTLIVNTGANTIGNAGLMAASSGGVVDLHGTVANAGGTIGAGGGTVRLDGVTVGGGTLATSAGGTIQVVGSAALDGTVTLASGAQIDVAAGETLSVLGHGSSDSVAALLVSGTATLFGGGTVALADGSGAGTAATQVIIGTAPGDTLDNVDNTISGYGTIDGSTLVLANGSGGVIDANVAGALLQLGPNVINQGLLAATDGGELRISGTLDNDGGTVEASAGATVTASTIDDGSIVAAGGTIIVDQVDVGLSAASSGRLSVAGAGSNLHLTGQLTVGDAGAGVLSILSSGSVSAANVDIGVQAGGSGTVDLEGAGARFSVAGTLNVGDAGNAVLTLGANTELTVGGTLNVGVGGVLNLLGGIIDPAILNITGQVNGSGTIIASDAIINTGTLFIGNGTVTLSAPAITGAGVLQVGGNGNLVLNAGSVANAQTVTFADATGVLTIGTISDFAATIGNYVSGDAIVVQDPSVSSDSFDPATHVLTLYDDSDTAIGTLQFSPTVTGPDLTVTIGDAPCFVAGTRIGTEQGEIAVEALRVGDRVQTLLSRKAAPVVWIGHRHVDCMRHPQPRKVWPVRISAGAFGPGRPCRELWLSPDHAVYVIDVLIPVKQLINGATIAQVPVDTVTYYHVELPGHDVLLAEGLPAESYLDTGDRANFVNGGGPIALYPDFASRVWEAEGCARLVVTGPELAAARHWVNALAARAASPARPARLRRRAR